MFHSKRLLSGCSVNRFMMTSRPWLRRRFFSFVNAALICLGASSAQADNGWWNTANGTWSSTTNWWTTAGGTTTVAAVPTTGQTATFNGNGVSGNQTVYLDGARGVLSLAFNNTGTTTLLGGTSGSPASNTLTLGGASGITVNAGAGPVTIGSVGAPVPIALGASQTWTNSSSNPLTIANVISGSGFAPTYAGAGATVLLGANTHTQGSVTNATVTGLVRIGVSSVGTTASFTSGPFGSGGGTNQRLVMNGGTVTSDSSTPRTVLNYLAFTGNANFGDPVFNGKLTFGNGGTLGAAVRTFGVHSEAEIQGDITNGGITKQGGSTLTLSGNNSYVNTTTVGAGTLALGNGGNLAATAVTVNGGGTFAVRQNASSTTNTVGNATFTLLAGSFLNMADGFTTTLNLGGNASFAPATGTRPVMSFNLSGASSDTINVTGVGNAGAAGATIAFANPTTALTAGNRTLITGGAGSALSTNFSLASSLLVGGQGLYSLSLSPSTATATIVNVADDPNALYWTGASGSVWNVAATWNNAISGGTPSASAPGSTSNVAFATTSPSPSNLATSLGGNTTVNSLNFLAGAPAVTIAAGNTLTINGGGITNLGSSAQTINAPIALGANQTWSNQGTGLLTIAGAVTNTTRNLAVTGTGNMSITGGLGNGAGTLTKTGTGTLALSGLSASAASNFSGTTFIDNGTVVITGTSPVFTGGLTFGSNVPATSLPNNPTTGTLDLSNASATFGGLTVRTTTLAANRILIGAAQTLTVNGTVSIGTSAQTTFYTSRLDVAGDGGLVVNGSLFQVANSTGTNNSGVAILDMSGLTTFTANLGGAGLFRVGDTGSGNPAQQTYAKLAATSTITAGTLGIGENSGNAGPITLFLGSDQQTLNVNTILLGLNAGSTQRASAAIRFDTAAGSLRIRSATDPINGSADLRMGQNASTTGGGITTTFDVSNHDADIKLGDLLMAARNAVSANTQTDSFFFDTGTLEVANQAILANSTGNNTSSNIATITLGGSSIGNGTATFTNGLSLAQNAGTNVTARSSTATLTIQANPGYSFAVTSGTITMATLTGSTNASNQANATLNVRGGSLTMTGNITAGGSGLGTASRIVNLSGGTLDMQGNAIGSGSGLITANIESGTLRNLGELNGGGALTKTTAGTLVVGGTNTYTGATTINAGTLLVEGTGSINGTSGISVASGAAFIYESSTALTPSVSLVSGSRIGGDGVLANLSLVSGVNFVFDPLKTLDVTGTATLANSFSVANLVNADGSALDWSGVADGTYTLINNSGNFSNISNFGVANAADIGGGRSAYFQNGSLQLVVVPEPATLLLGASGLAAGLFAWRRRRALRGRVPTVLGLILLGMTISATAIAGDSTVTAAAPAAIKPQRPSTTEPLKYENCKSYDYPKRHATILATKAEINPQVVFIGDSITHHWGGPPSDRLKNGEAVLKSDLAEYRTLNLGFGHDRTQHVIWRLQNGEIDGISPDWVVIHIGTNNVNDFYPAEEIMDGIRVICEEVKKRTPKSRVVLMSILPRQAQPNHSRRVRANEVNVLIAKYAAENDLIHLDIGREFLNEKDEVRRELMPDTLHPNADGYRIWAKALREVFEGKK
jgi:autotransporter-associated beta strand protein